MKLSLPFPPTVNTYWRSLVIKGRVRVVLSKAGRAYQVDAQAAVLPVHGMLTPLDGRLSVTMLVYPPDRRARDLDNLGKAVLDALKVVRAIQDDSQIDELAIKRQEVRPGGAVEVIVQQIAQESPRMPQDAT